MSLREEAATLVIAGIPGETVDETARRLVVQDKIGGIILFRRNVRSPEQTHSLIRELKGLRTQPLLLSVDQEGGRVQRLRRPFTEFPAMRALGDTGDLALAREVGAQLGREVRAVGFDFDFAPVVDVDTNANNPVIGDRSFSSAPDLVSAMATAVAQGLGDAGVLSCAKHFPGHGDTLEDSHHDLPTLPHDYERLRRVEWPPFAALAKAGVDSVMTAHVVFSALDPQVPATLSKKCLDILRHELGFQRAIISDDLEMKAIADRYSVPEAAVQAIAAGCDTLLVCHSYERQQATIDALVKAVEGRRIDADRWAMALRNTRALLAKAHKPAAAYVAPQPPSGRLAAWLAERGVFAGLDPTEAVGYARTT